MGHKYIYNYEVVAKSISTNQHFKDMQHMFRRSVVTTENSQSTQQTSSGKLVSELLPSFASTSQVELVLLLGNAA